MWRTSSLTTIVFILLSQSVQSQEGLPPILKSNVFLSGQLYGCIVRFEAYSRLTASQPDSPIKLEDASKVAAMQVGLDFVRLKDDIFKSPLFSSNADEHKKFVDIIEKVAEAEFTDKRNTTWAQAAGCSLLAHNLGLYDKYSPK